MSDVNNELTGIEFQQIGDKVKKGLRDVIDLDDPTVEALVAVCLKAVPNMLSRYSSEWNKLRNEGGVSLPEWDEVAPMLKHAFIADDIIQSICVMSKTISYEATRRPIRTTPKAVLVAEYL